MTIATLTELNCPYDFYYNYVVNSGGDVRVNRSLPSVAITFGDDTEHFLESTDAEDWLEDLNALIDEFPDTDLEVLELVNCYKFADL